MNNITENILQKIKDGELAMQPRWHFLLRAALMMMGVVLVALISVYLLSFLLFTLQRSGLLFAPGFGWHGIMMFVVSSPWLLIAVLLVFLLTLYVLVSTYSFSYRKPLVFSMIGLVLFVLTVSAGIQYYGIHNRVQAFAERHNVPGLRPLYQDSVGRRPAGIERGVISEQTDSGFVLTTDTGEQLQIVTSNRTKVPPQLELVPNLEVLVFGDRTGETVNAFGVKLAHENDYQVSPKGLRPGMPR